MKQQIKVIWLKITKNTGTDKNGEPVREIGTIKLVEGNNWKKFLNNLPFHNLNLSADFGPKVVKVMDKITGEEIKGYADKFQSQVDEVLKPKPVNKSSKELEDENKKLNDTVSDMQEKIDLLMDEMKALKADSNSEKSEERKALEEKANKLGIKFRTNISDDKLQEKINEQKDK